MIDRLLFHIGDAKTGTSSIQTALRNRIWKTEGPVLVPQPELNAIGLAKAVDRNGKKSRLLFEQKSRWAAENAGDIGVISSEFFARNDPISFRRALETHLPEYAHTARILAYFRPHAPLIVSSFAQRAKSGTFTGNLDAFIVEIAHRPRFSGMKRFGPWRDTFGDRFILRPFIRDALKDHDVVADFFDIALEGAPFTLTADTHSNESLSVELLATLAHVHKVLQTEGVNETLPGAIGGAMMRLVARRKSREGTKVRLHKAAALRIQELWHKDAKQLDATFFAAPLMQNALDTAVDLAIDKPQDFSISACLSETAIADIDDIARHLADCLKRHPKAWRESYRRSLGQKPNATPHDLNRRQRANVDTVWADLERILDRYSEDLATRQR